MTDLVAQVDDGPDSRPAPLGPGVDTAAALAAAEAIEAVAAVLERHLEAWPSEVARIESWTGPRRQEFDGDVEVFLAEAVHHPATLRSVAAMLRTWAEAP